MNNKAERVFNKLSFIMREVKDPSKAEYKRNDKYYVALSTNSRWGPEKEGYKPLKSKKDKPQGKKVRGEGDTMGKKAQQIAAINPETLSPERAEKAHRALKQKGFKRVRGYKPTPYKEIEDKVKSKRNKAVATHAGAGAIGGGAAGLLAGLATKGKVKGISPKRFLGLATGIPAAISALSAGATSRSINDNKKVRRIAKKMDLRNQLVEHQLERSGKPYQIYKKSK